MSRLTDSQSNAFFKNVVPVTESGCWLWIGRTSEKGYGKCSIKNRSTMVHRIAYEHFKGAIPDGLTVDHLCRVRCCVNPDHLHACTNQENVLSGIGRTAANARKTHCVHGHAFTKSNTRYYNGRNCRACHQDRKRLARLSR